MDEKALQAALWYKQLCATNNDVFLPLFFDHHRHLILMGGGGSGKSIFAGRKVLERCATEPGHRMLVVRKVAKTLRESCFDQLKAQAMQYYGPAVKMIPRGKSGDMYITFTNGSEILFAGLDDVEKLKSIHDISGIWIEEASELLEGDFNQLDIRLRGERKYYKQIIISFNPISITHWLKKRFFDREDDRVATSRTTYKDNRFLPEEDRLTLEAFRETDPYYYQVYCLGQWGVLSQTIFRRDILMERLMHCKKPIRRGRFAYRYDETAITDAAFTDAEDGETLVWEEPKAGHPYVIGADTAGEGSDWFVACVIDNSTGRLVAKYRTRTDEDLFAREVWCLGMWYNQALVGIEANFSTHPIKELSRLRYPRQFVRQVEDSLTHVVREALGFRTDRLTRPVIIAELQGIMREHPELIDDEDCLNEMLTFARNSKGRPEAVEGAHDDCVMALAITYYVRQQQRATVETRHKRVKWDKDQWADYRSADATERAYLIGKWGNPF